MLVLDLMLTWCLSSLLTLCCALVGLGKELGKALVRPELQQKWHPWHSHCLITAHLSPR